MDRVFVPFQKIPRLKRDCVITEKIDGTNAQIVIENGEIIAVGSRSRWITPGKNTDNYGFAAWVEQNAEELKKLGDGTHFGEWWGEGVQRGYGVKGKRFSLFNVGRWEFAALPTCVSLVPILYKGIFDDTAIEVALQTLRTEGSLAAPGFMKPEGIIVYHVASRDLFKVTLEKDEEPKGARRAEGRLMSSGWIGVDLDGTLAHYDRWRGSKHIGAIIPNMRDHVLQWLENGNIVKIFTARVACGDDERREVISVIQDWLEENGLPRLEVTNVKDFGMIRLYDDRAVRVIFNEGIPVL